MLKSFTAITREIDDVNAAVTEILRQLDMDGENRMLKNTVGIVSCYAEFVESGVLAALCQKLPFPVLGTTTIANMAAGQMGETMLTLMVLTSDEVAFATALSAPITGEDAAPLHAVYAGAKAGLPQSPALMMSFLPLLSNFGSDFYVDSMTEISGGVPNFGTLAVDHNEDYHESAVLYNGEAHADRLALLLFCGPITPSFYVGNISDEKIFEGTGVVTAAAASQLQSVDDAPVLDFLLSLGLTQNADGSVNGINSFPIIVDYNDGSTPVARAMFALTPAGHAVCGGNIPVGATLSIGEFDPDEIAATAARTVDAALAKAGPTVMLMYSCIGRYFSQGLNTTAELERVAPQLDASGRSYMVAYSGGELCPVYGPGGKTINRNHNNTFVVCAF